MLTANSSQLQIVNKTGESNFSKRVTKKPSAKNKKKKEPELDPETLMKNMLLNNMHLVSGELDENEINQNEKKIMKKKEIVSYISNRDTLFIPYPERPIRPVDIRSNIVEEDKKKLVADVGMQCDNINYVNPEKPYIPQKIGKDIGVQIEDGDLFNFDKDVQPLLTVLCGKILEQADLELCQEAEMKNLRETKNSYLKKLKAYKEDIKTQEEEEAVRKKDIDNLKKMKTMERMSKIDTQQKLTARVFSKGYLRNFYQNVKNELINRKVFLDYSNINIKDVLNQYSIKNVEDIILDNVNLNNSLLNVSQEIFKNKLKSHSDTILGHKNKIERKKEETERKRKEEEERLRKEEEDRKERRRLRAIRKLRMSIKNQIFDSGANKGFYFSEEISILDNYELDTAYGNYIIKYNLIFSRYLWRSRRCFCYGSLYFKKEFFPIRILLHNRNCKYMTY